MKKESKLAEFLYSEGNLYKVTRFVFSLVAFYLIIALVVFGRGIAHMIDYGITFDMVLRLLAESIPTLICIFAAYGILVAAVKIGKDMKK